MSLIDTHCHLNHPPLCGDTDGVLARATAAGVTRVIVPAYDLACWDDLENLHDRPGVRVAYGLHPWLAHDLPGQLRALTPQDGPGTVETQANLESLRRALAVRLATGHPVAVGEIGLDTKITASNLAQQLPLFEVQLQLAADLDLPVILHCRGAFEEMLTALGRHGGRLRGVVHAYSRGPDLAERICGAGLHIALGGAITRGRARQVRRAAQTVPLGRIVLETDAPSIGLEGVKPDDTEPRHVRDVAEALAGLRHETMTAIATATSNNATALFGLAGE